jgi:hypothetical protein
MPGPTDVIAVMSLGPNRPPAARNPLPVSNGMDAPTLTNWHRCARVELAKQPLNRWERPR